MKYLWDIFEEISSRRDYIAGDMVVIAQPIKARDVLEHCAYFKLELLLWERRVIFDLDDTVLPILNTPKKDKVTGFDPSDVSSIAENYRAAANKKKGD